MSSDWRSVLNKYLSEFEAKTSTALENMNESLLQSGQKFNARIRKLMEKSVNNRLQQTMDFFDIQSGSKACERAQCAGNVGPNGEVTERNDQLESNESSVEFVESEIKIETVSSEDDESVEIVSSSQSTPETGAAARQPAMNLGNEINRASLNSSILDQQRSPCSPSTSNLPMATTPIGTPNSILTATPDINAAESRQEPRDTIEKLIWNQWHADEYGVKLEDMSADDLFTDMKREEEKGTPSTSQTNTGRSVPPMWTESQSLKRQHTDNVPNETIKRQKVANEVQPTEPSIGTDIVFACFHCRSNFYVETFAEVYEHWRSSHILKPFRFIAFKKAACFFCGKFDVFSNLRDHHKHEHHAEIFIVVTDENKSTCGLCHKTFSLSEMVVHFKSEHDPMHYMGIPNPICFTQTELEQLLSVHLPQTFSRDEVDAFGEIDAFMCGHCNTTKNVSEMSFMQHLEEDAFQFKCSVCPFLGNSIDETILHESSVHCLLIDKQKHLNGLMGRLDRHFLRTRVIFSNGLVLWKHNMLNSTFDDHDEFRPFKGRLRKQKLAESDATPSLPTIPHKKPESEKVLRTKQLAKQLANSNFLHISGISVAVNTKKGLLETFLLICEAMGLTDVDAHAIQDIHRMRSNAVVVRMQTTEMTKQILGAWIKSTKTGLPPACNVLIQPELTPFFLNLWKLAKKAQKNNQIHSFWMTDDGLAVKRNKNSRKTIVWSQVDLKKCIAGTL